MAKSNSYPLAVLNAAARSIWVPIYFFANIFLTGFLFGSINIVPGYSDHLWDLIQGLLGGATFYFIAAFYARKTQFFSNGQLTLIYLVPPLINSILPGALVWAFISKPAGEKILKDFLISYSSLFGQFFIFALLVGAFKYSRNLSKSVASQYQALTYIRQELASGIAESKAKLMAQIQEILKSSSSNFKAENADEIHTGLQEIIDGAVRPLSHQIDAEATTLTKFDAEVESAKLKARKVPLREQLKRRVPLTLAVNPLITVVLYLNFVATTMVFLFGYQSLWQLFAPFIAISYLLYLGFEKLTGNRRGNIFIVLILGLLLSLTQSLVFALLSARRADYDQGQLQAISFTIYLITAGTMIYGILLLNIVENSKSAEKFNLELAKESKAVRQQLWHLHKRVARELHGSLQSKLQIAALKAENVDLQGFYVELNAAISAPELQTPASISELLNDLIEFWDGVCQIKLEASVGTLKTIENQPILSEYLYEVIRENINNSIKHAASNVISIEIKLLSDSIVLEMINNVQKTIEISAKKQSLGSKIFEELAETWSLELGEKQARFIATLLLNR